jgi:hypothetical protein
MKLNFSIIKFISLSFVLKAEAPNLLGFAKTVANSGELISETRLRFELNFIKISVEEDSIS